MRALVCTVLMCISTLAVARTRPPVRFVDQYGYKWTIRYVTASEMRVYSHGEPGFIGFTEDDPLVREIRVLSGLDLDEEQDTVLHELCHVVVGTIYSDTLMKNHAWIKLTTPGLSVILRKNPAFLKYFGASE